MSNLPHNLTLTFLAAGLTITGCATKKHVRTKIQPLEVRVEKLEEKSKTLETALADSERVASRADERAQSADGRVTEVSATAKTAAERAANAENTAGVAKSLAESSFQKSQDVERKLTTLGTAQASTVLADNLQLVSRDNVLFGVGAVLLSQSAREQLDTVAAKLPKAQRFALELQGFADPSGPAARNIELSQRRAEAVARYLNIRHSIPLHRMHVLGMGSEKLAQSKSVAAKRLARRVEVKLYAGDGGTTSGTRPAAATSAAVR